jgi:predicted  nucleic acid-binding Zn-ribbon protein
MILGTGWKFPECLVMFGAYRLCHFPKWSVRNVHNRLLAGVLHQLGSLLTRIDCEICALRETFVFMGQESSQARCIQCGHTFDDNGTVSENRSPCPDCGVVARETSVQVSDTIEIWDSLKVKGSRRPGKKKRYVEASFQERDWHRDEARWTLRTKVVNRADDEYHEVITDLESGNVVHECHEPLSRHTGHGSARQPSPKSVETQNTTEGP